MRRDKTENEKCADAGGYEFRDWPPGMATSCVRLNMSTIQKMVPRGTDPGRFNMTTLKTMVIQIHEGASVEVQRIEGFSAAKNFQRRLMVMGSTKDGTCSPHQYLDWWRELERGGAELFLSETWSHEDFDFFLEGTFFRQDEAEWAALTAMLTEYLDPFSEIPRRKMAAGFVG